MYIKLYLIEEKGRTFNKETEFSILKQCSKKFNDAVLDVSGGYNYIKGTKLIDEIYDNYNKDYDEQVIVYVYSECELIYYCAGIDFLEFDYLASNNEDVEVLDILSDLASRNLKKKQIKNEI